MQKTSNRLDCPSCHQQDQVQKVSAIVSAGVSTGSASGTTRYYDSRSRSLGSDFTSISVDNVSILSSMLAPPFKPRLGNTTKINMGLMAGAIVLAALGFCSGISSLLSLFSGYSHQLSSGCIWPLAFFIAAGVLGARSRSVDEQKVRQHEQEMQRYLAANAKWNQAFYCSRCDQAFIPGQLGYVPASSVQRWLYL